MLDLKTKVDLEALHHNQVPESLTLEYKSSLAIENTESRKIEIAKDVSAMANADGGQIVYGMTETNGVLTGLDAGIDPRRFNGLWFEQVIQQNIQPQIEGLSITQIPLDNGNVAVVLTIPAALTLAPHRSKDGRYYRRRNFRNDIMEDYEIREAMRRTTTPKLDVAPTFTNTGSPTSANLTAIGEQQGIEIEFVVANRANQPAEYAVLRVYIDARLQITGSERFSGGHQEIALDTLCRVFKCNFGLPQSSPIFRESPEVGSKLRFIVPGGANLIGRYELGCDIRTPGYSLLKRWAVTQFGPGLTIEPLDPTDATPT